MNSRKQRSGWTPNDELNLLEKWEARSQDLRRAKRNAHIYHDMATEMGGKYTAEEIHCKVTNLTKKDREEKGKMGPSGGSPSTWRHYQAVHRIIGSTAVNSAMYVETYSVNSIQIQLPPLSPSPSPSLPSPSPSPSLPSPSPSPSPSLPSPTPSLPSPPPSPSPAPSSATVTSAENKRNYSREMMKIMKEQTEVLKTSAEDARLATEEIVEAMREQNRMTGQFLILMEKLTEKL